MAAPVERSRTPLPEADQRAAELLDLLRPFCDQLQVAGSVRRRVGAVKDIELCAVPRIEPQAVPSLFEDAPPLLVDALDAEMTELLHRGTFIPYVNRRGSPHWGKRNKRAWYQGAAVDLWCATADEWGILLAIRTGPAGYSQAFVTPVKQRFPVPRADGTVVYREGLLPLGYRVEHHRLYGGDGRIIETPTEEAFFAAIGQPYREPWQRR